MLVVLSYDNLSATTSPNLTDKSENSVALKLKIIVSPSLAYAKESKVNTDIDR